MNGCMNGWIDLQTDGWIHEQVNRQTQTNRWLERHELTGGQMDRLEWNRAEHTDVKE